MAKTEHQKELLSAWRERTVVGGVCAIRCTETNRVLLSAVTDPAGLRNRFQFSAATGSCTFLPLSADWNQYGAASFTFTVLEELEKGADQTDAQFKADLEALAALWRERLASEGAEFYTK